MKRKGDFLFFALFVNEWTVWCCVLYIYLERKWPLFCLEIQPCFEGLTFQNRGHWGFRYTFMFTVCTLWRMHRLLEWMRSYHLLLQSAHYGGVSSILLIFSCLLFAYCLWGSGWGFWLRSFCLLCWRLREDGATGRIIVKYGRNNMLKMKGTYSIQRNESSHTGRGKRAKRIQLQNPKLSSSFCLVEEPRFPLKVNKCFF